jgi:hypothetical protein
MELLPNVKLGTYQPHSVVAYKFLLPESGTVASSSKSAFKQPLLGGTNQSAVSDMYTIGNHFTFIEALLPV